MSSTFKAPRNLATAAGDHGQSVRRKTFCYSAFEVGQLIVNAVSAQLR